MFNTLMLSVTKKSLLFILLLIFLAGLGLLFKIKYIDTNSNNWGSSLNTENVGTVITESFKDAYVSPISIDYLRSLSYPGSDIKIEQVLPDGANYTQYLASYKSEGYTIYGLLTVPTTEAPEGGFPAIVFNHGYIPPSEYKTTEKYIAYVDYLARNNFVVFKIDLRGHGQSEGNPSGTYFSSSYTVDALNAVSSLQKYDVVNPNKIGIWGHSMGGNLALRALLISDDIKAAVIWAGAVYSYEDFAKYRISDNSFRGMPSTPTNIFDKNRESSKEVSDLRSDSSLVDFTSNFWKSISLTQNLQYLNTPIQLHHSKNDDVVNLGYSIDLAKVLDEKGKTYEVYYYDGGGHNITSPYFEQAMGRTVEFYRKYLNQ